MREEPRVRTSDRRRVATSWDETPTLFAAGGETLFGILTRATAAPVGTAVIAIQGGAYVPSTHRNRMWVRLCRAVAAEGLHAMRFDYHGVGESTGVVQRYRLDEPFVDDLMGAVGWLQAEGIERFIAVGTCFGARTALSAAGQIAGLAGLVLISCPVRDFEQEEKTSTHLADHWSLGRYVRNAVRPQVLIGLFDARRRRSYSRLAKAKLHTLARSGRGKGSADRYASPNFLQPLSQLVERRIPVLFVYGAEDMAHEAFSGALGGRLGELVSRDQSPIRVETVPGLLDGFPQIEAQDRCLTIVREWITSHRGKSGGTPMEEDATWTSA